MLDLNKLEDDLDKTLGCETKESLDKWLSEKRNKQGKFVIINLDTMDYFKDNLKNINYFDNIEDARQTAWLVAEKFNIPCFNLKNTKDFDRIVCNLKIKL